MAKNKNKKESKKTTKKVVTTTTTTTTTTTEVDKNLDTHYLLVLDRSGSMGSCWDATIEGLNEQLGTIRGLNEKYPEQRYFLTIVAFDDQIETIIEDKPIDEVKDFDGTEFPPRGMTSLHDAMGISISNLKSKLENKDKDSDSISTALVVVMTDGHENNSKEYDANSLKEMIEDLDKTDAWTFSYMGANQDAVLTASGFGISAGNSVNYHSTATGAKAAYGTLSKAVSARAMASNVSYTSSLDDIGEVSLDSINIDNKNFMSNVVNGDTISEDDSEDTNK